MVLAGHRGLPRGHQAGGAQEVRTADARQGRGRRLSDVRAFHRSGTAGRGRRAGEARGLGHGHVGTQHLLLAILAGPDDPVAEVLIGMGLDHEAARRSVVRLLGPGGRRRGAARGAPGGGRPRAAGGRRPRAGPGGRAPGGGGETGPSGPVRRG
ncbi:Clp protease N-terminal domain-containing protein [Kitasatospora sp. NPDC017646]|uniref:Clp protease N-terminal domain-containing protein n=1 Tax=Kitasatospora sp. NPDC017646 TaxID=3364024 RepID=UPI0037B82525